MTTTPFPRPSTMGGNAIHNAPLTRRSILKSAAIAAAMSVTLPNMLANAQGDEPFVIANEAEPTFVGPFFTGFGPAMVTRSIYQPLVETRLERNGDGEVEIVRVPRLAERWERVDDTRWRFFLRPDVVFHNGEPWNSEAARVSFEAMSNPDILTEYRAFNALGNIATLDVVDDLTIDFVTSRPDSEILAIALRLGFVGMPAEALQSGGMAALMENPAGTGPYQLDAFERGQEVRLSLFADYWDPDGPTIPAVRSLLRPEAAVRAQTILAGEADFAYNVGGEQAQTLPRSVVGGGFQSSAIRLNNTIAPTNDLRVRQAINYAIDRDAIADAIFAGTATPIGFFAYQPVEVAPFAYDPERAASLLEEAGATGAELELVYGEQRIPEEDQLAEIYKAYLEAVGLRIQLNRVERVQYTEVDQSPFDQQPTMMMETTSSGNYGEVAGSLFDKYGCEGSGTYCNPELEEEFALMYTLDGEEREDVLQSIAERLQFEETPRCWVVAVNQVHGLSERVETSFPLNTYILLDDISVT